MIKIGSPIEGGKHFQEALELVRGDSRTPEGLARIRLLASLAPMKERKIVGDLVEAYSVTFKSSAGR